MNWILRWTLLLGILGISFQTICPFANLQGSYDPGIGHEPSSHFAASNIIDKYAENHYVPSKYYGPLKPVPQGGLTGTDINTLVQSYFNPNSGHRNGPPHGEHGEVSFDSIFNSGAPDISCAQPPTSCANDSANYFFRTYDGSCNNLAYPGYGMARSRFMRLLAPKYGDGKYTPGKSTSGEPLPNPRLLSLSVYGEETTPDNYLTYMTMQFGQFVSHDLSKQSIQGAPKDCCEEPNHKLCYSIPLAPYGPISLTSGKKCLSFSRALSDWDISCPASGLHHSEKITTTTSYLDLSSLYGNSLEDNIKVRQFRGGLLKAVWYNNRPYLPTQGNVNGECRNDNSECYSIPDNRNDLTPPIAIIHTIFMREHNRLASVLAQLNPQYSDEKLFQIARKINIAQYQKIAYYEWLPLVLGRIHCYEQGLIHNVPPYEYVNDYDESLESGAFAESSASALRYCHHQIPGWFSMVSPGRDRNNTLRLSDYTSRTENINFLQEGHNFDDLVRGMVTQLQKRSDPNIDKEIKHHFIRKPFDEFGVDLKSVDIQRSRDYALAGYNDYRELCGLQRAYDWSGFRHEISDEHIAMMQKLYASPNDVDLSVGASLEAHAAESLFGPTFQCIASKQFMRTRRSDRFFFEREDYRTGFTRDQLASIRSVTMSSILCANSNSLKRMQANAFMFPYANNDLLDCNTIPQLNLALWKDHAGY